MDFGYACALQRALFSLVATCIKRWEPWFERLCRVALKPGTFAQKRYISASAVSNRLVDAAAVLLKTLCCYVARPDFHGPLVCLFMGQLLCSGAVRSCPG